MGPNHFDQEVRFIRKVRSALGYDATVSRSLEEVPAHAAPEDPDQIARQIRNRTAHDNRKLLDRLMNEANRLNLKVLPLTDLHSVASSIIKLVQDKAPEWGRQKSLIAWRHPLIDKLNLAEALAVHDVPVYISEVGDPVERETVREQIISSFIGVTSADYCIAESATLVIKTRPGQARSVSLVPSIHVAVIELNQIIADLRELFVLLRCDPKQQMEGLTRCMTFISGPSKTADIEFTIVHGAHGPREVYLYVVA